MVSFDKGNNAEQRVDFQVSLLVLLAASVYAVAVLGSWWDRAGTTRVVPRSGASSVHSSVSADDPVHTEFADHHETLLPPSQLA